MIEVRVHQEGRSVQINLKQRVYHEKNYKKQKNKNLFCFSKIKFTSAISLRLPFQLFSLEHDPTTLCIIQTKNTIVKHCTGSQWKFTLFIVIIYNRK